MYLQNQIPDSRTFATFFDYFAESFMFLSLTAIANEALTMAKQKPENSCYSRS
jgi:hypothetical protein